MEVPFLARGFKSVKERLNDDLRPKDSSLEFGIHYLDSALKGIFTDDLILIGASSGLGKTQFCVNLAITNTRKNKKVYLFALEASQNEIEDRIKYQMLAKEFFKDPLRPTLSKSLNYTDWRFRLFDKELQVYDIKTEEHLQNFFTFYKDKDFGIKELKDNIYGIAGDADLIIIDHAHYFDYEDDNENRALKEIAKSVRNISQIIRKPIVLVAHLRKPNKAMRELVPSIDEFHGSSDLTKIATRVITIAKGNSDRLTSETFIRVCKNRFDGSTCNYVGLVKFDFQKQIYEDRFSLGTLSYDGREFEPIEDVTRYPLWIK